MVLKLDLNIRRPTQACHQVMRVECKEVAAVRRWPASLRVLCEALPQFLRLDRTLYVFLCQYCLHYNFYVDDTANVNQLFDLFVFIP